MLPLFKKPTAMESNLYPSKYASPKGLFTVGKPGLNGITLQHILLRFLQKIFIMLKPV